MGQQAAVNAGLFAGAAAGEFVNTLTSDPSQIGSTIPITAGSNNIQLSLTSHPTMVSSYPIQLPPGYATVESGTVVETIYSGNTQANFGVYPA
jgi:uncharacterized membrane protein